MLNSDALSQLGALRQNLRANQPRLEGQVLPTRQRTGVVVTDSADRYLLSAEAMLKLLPGDRIVFVATTQVDPPEAQFEALLDVEIDTAVGRLLAHKGKRWVQLDHVDTQRRLPIHPDSIGAVALGSWVQCSIVRAEDASPSARIEALIAEPDAPFWMHHVAMARCERSMAFPESVQDEVLALEMCPIPADYVDLSALGWVTIDQDKTQDMDDAIHVEATETGWILNVAIADATHWVLPGSALDEAAQQRYASQYLPGLTIPMLPDAIGHSLCALVPNEARGALVFQANISELGIVRSYSFQFARVQSQAKLSYEQVNQALAGSNLLGDHQSMLTEAVALAQCLREQRQRGCLTSADRPEYQLIVDELGLLSEVHLQQRGLAERLIEELMLLTNHLAARHLAEHQVGIFLQHNGFKSDRWPQVQQLLDPLFPDPLTESISFTQFQTVLAQLERVDARLPMLLSRHYCRSELSIEPLPHWGLGLSCYTTVTSPIRRYLDLVLHRQLKAIWRGESVPSVSRTDELAQGHFAQRDLERLVTRWLYAHWMAPKVGETFSAEVQHLMPTGCLVLVDGIGCSGFVPLRPWQDEQATFDPVWMQHHLSFGDLALGDCVRVKLQRVDVDQRQMMFELQPE